MWQTQMDNRWKTQMETHGQHMETRNETTWTTHIEKTNTWTYTYEQKQMQKQTYEKHMDIYMRKQHMDTYMGHT